MKWIKLKHQQCDNFFYNNKTKHNSVQTFCRTPSEHLQEQKKTTTTTKNYHNHKTKHNSVHTFCQTPGKHLQDTKKDNKNNKNLSKQNQAVTGR
jgi:hypothetical protein